MPPVVAGLPPIIGPRASDAKLPKPGNTPATLPKPHPTPPTAPPVATPQSPPANPPGRGETSDKRVPNLSQHFTSVYRPDKKFHGPGESELVNKVLQDLNGGNHAKALTNLDTWMHRYPESDFSDDRAYYYMEVYHALNQPAKVVDAVAPLLAKDLRVSFAEPLQIVGVLYLAVLNAQKIQNPVKQQIAAGRSAAYGLLAYLPVCFTAENRPATISAADWTKARNDLESLARQTLKR
jgi:hypothetical protein